MTKEESANIDNILSGTFNTPIGQKCIEHLKKTFVDRDIYRNGATLDAVAYRQGQADVIKQILNQMERINGR